MNIASSIGSIFSGNKIPSNLANNLSLLQQLSQSPQKSGAKLSNASGGLNLKQLGTFPTAGIGGVTYDFQELLGLKSPPNTSSTENSGETSKQESAAEVLASLQMKQQQKATNAVNNNSNAHLDIDTTSLPNNPTISPVSYTHLLRSSKKARNVLYCKDSDCFSTNFLSPCSDVIGRSLCL